MLRILSIKIYSLLVFGFLLLIVNFLSIPQTIDEIYFLVEFNKYKLIEYSIDGIKYETRGDGKSRRIVNNITIFSENLTLHLSVPKEKWLCFVFFSSEFKQINKQSGYFYKNAVHYAMGGSFPGFSAHTRQWICIDLSFKIITIFISYRCFQFLFKKKARDV